MNTEFFSIVVATVLALVLLLVWVLVALPQRRARATQQEVLEQIKVGDEVVTVGGIIGRLTFLDREADLARIEVAKGVEMRVIPSAISHPLDILDRIRTAERGGAKPAQKTGKR
ncbi:MAG: preprotein translocase subunit YajC [Thermoflexales bacterium]|nr:preprotein translocase subunit YajC [Thermoflexales bacterium]